MPTLTTPAPVRNRRHTRGCNCPSCRERSWETESFFSRLFDALKPPRPVRVPPSQLAAAVAYNRRHARRLGWYPHSARIAKQLLRMKTRQPDGQPFAAAVLRWQASNGLTADGKLGPRTWRAMQKKLGLTTQPAAPGGGQSTATVVTPYRRVFPMPVLPDGRRPEISSGHWHENPSRAPRGPGNPKGVYFGHQGADIMYRYDPQRDPPRAELARKKRITGKFWLPESVWARAFAPGVVRRVGKQDNGWRLYIRHADGLESAYRHLSKPIVQDGQRVQAGDKLAQLSHLGNPAHLHFELREKGRYAYEQSINPRPYLTRIPFPKP